MSMFWVWFIDLTSAAVFFSLVNHVLGGFNYKGFIKTNAFKQLTIHYFLLAFVLYMECIGLGDSPMHIKQLHFFGAVDMPVTAPLDLLGFYAFIRFVVALGTIQSDKNGTKIRSLSEEVDLPSFKKDQCPCQLCATYKNLEMCGKTAWNAWRPTGKSNTF